MQLNKIYGDGIHDDHAGIQELLDSGVSTVYLPVPKKHYVISKPLLIHSNQTLRLDEQTKITLADNANCCMLQNSDTENGNKNVVVDGGIWDMNHSKQWPNPWHFPRTENEKVVSYDYLKEKYGWTPKDGRLVPEYDGFCFRFCRIVNFTFKNITIVNPVVYGVQMGYVSYFTIDNIRFDYTEGSPKLWNLDGIHLEGGCCYGRITNLKGACHDDLLALTSNDTIWGPIHDIEVDGIFAENSHSAVRFLSRGLPVKNISIKNVFGSFYVYGIIMSRYVEVEGERGVFENISVENFFGNICKGTVDVKGNYCGLIHIMSGLDMKNITFRNIVREENNCYLPTIWIYKDTKIDCLVVDGLHQTVKDGNEVIPILSEADIDKLEIKNVFGGKSQIKGAL